MVLYIFDVHRTLIQACGRELVTVKEGWYPLS